MGRLLGRAGELRVTIHSLATCQGRVWVVGSEPVLPRWTHRISPRTKIVNRFKLRFGSER